MKLNTPFWLTHRQAGVEAERTPHYYDLLTIIWNWLEADWARRLDADKSPRVTINFIGPRIF